MRKNSIKRQVEAFRTKAIKRRSGWVVDPRTSRMMGFWDAATTICLVFTALVTPLEVGFFGGATSGSDPLFLVNRLVDLIFAIDLVLNFSLMYSIKTPKDGVKWIDDHKLIAIHYASGWFIPDLLSVVVVAFDIMALNETSMDRDVTCSASLPRRSKSLPSPGGETVHPCLPRAAFELRPPRRPAAPQPRRPNATLASTPPLPGLGHREA